MEYKGNTAMNRREFLSRVTVLSAAAWAYPTIEGMDRAMAAYNRNVWRQRLQIKETHLQFLELENRTVTDMIVIHHMGHTDKEVSAADVHRMHLNNGWSGIGYHYVIHKDGGIERGRPLNTVGAHCYKENRHTIGVNLVGNFEESYPTKRQMESASMLLAALCTVYRIEASEHTIVGHRDKNATLCPGEHLYARLPDLRARATKIMEV